MDVVEQLEMNQPKTFNSYTKKTDVKVSKGGKGLKAVPKKAAAATPKKSGPKKEITKKRAEQKKKAVDDGENAKPKKKSISSKIKIRSDKLSALDPSKVFSLAPIERMFRNEVSKQCGPDEKFIVSKVALTRVVSEVSRDFLALIHRIRTLMDYKGIKTMDGITPKVAILMSDPKYDWSKMDDESMGQIHEMLHKKIETV